MRDSIDPSEVANSLATNFYFETTFGCDAVKVLPGEFYVSKSDIAVVTVLGSCVSACVRDRFSGIGGMNHFMLPDSGGNLHSRRAAMRSMTYGNHAMQILIDELIKAGARRENLEAKVFGGGNVLSSLTTNSVGERNAAFVRHYLETENINLVAEDLIDIYPRKIFFFPKTGKVVVKKLKTVEADAVTKRDIAYTHSICHF